MTPLLSRVMGRFWELCCFRGSQEFLGTPAMVYLVHLQVWLHRAWPPQSRPQGEELLAGIAPPPPFPSHHLAGPDPPP